MLNWAIIGSGDVVNRLVGNSFEKKGISKVKYIFSKNTKEATKLNKKYNYGKVAKSVSEILRDNTVNSVYIATPPNLHAGYIKKFSKKKKFILCEKPLALTKKELNYIYKICKRNKISLITSFYRRYLTRFKFIKKILEKGELGKIITFNYRLFHSPETHPTAPFKPKKNMKNLPWRFQKKISGGGNFLDMGAHAIDMISYLISDIKKIQTIKNNRLNFYKVEETLVSNIELKNKIIGQASWSSVVNKTQDLFEIFGTKGSVIFSLNFSDEVAIQKGKKKFYKRIPFDKPFHKNLIKDTIKKFTKYKLNKTFIIEEQGFKVANLQLEATEND